MKYAKARHDDYVEEFIYRRYMSDSLNLLPEQSKLIDRYVDILNPPKETRSGDEIALDVIQNLGLRIKNECI